MDAKLAGRRRSDLVILVLSLLISAVIWLIHYLSQDYMTYLPFRISVVTSIEGYSPTSVSNETIILGGQAKGFYILRKRAGSGTNFVTVRLKPQSLTDEGDGRFSLNVSSVREALSDAVGSDFDITYVQDTRLTFNFVPQSYVKLPVRPFVNVSCKPQYMLGSEIVIKPDSVTVYGNTNELKERAWVDTKAISLKDVDGPLTGMVEIASSGFRVEPPMVEYFVDVQRYVEHRFTATISSVDVPEGKKLIFLPSRVEVTCRLPYGVRPYPLQEEGSLIVDYDDFLSSRSTRLAPKLVSGSTKVLEYSTNPPFVDCVLTEVD